LVPSLEAGEPKDRVARRTKGASRSVGQPAWHESTNGAAVCKRRRTSKARRSATGLLWPNGGRWRQNSVLSPCLCGA